MTQLTTINPGLPPFLAALAAKTGGHNDAFKGGISIGQGGHPRISIKGSKFAIIDSKGERTPVNSVSMDVILVGANPNLTKTYYDKDYDPKEGENVQPTCYSVNGIVPSKRSPAIQSSICATCKWNAWGSGKRGSGKRCADNKRVAVMLASGEDDRVFELRLPPTSLKDYGIFIEEMNTRQVPVPTVTVQLTFSDDEHPKVIFTPTGWVSEDIAEKVLAAVEGEAAKTATGLNDPEYADMAPAALAAPAQSAPLPQLPQAPVGEYDDLEIPAALKRSAPKKVVPPKAKFLEEEEDDVEIAKPGAAGAPQQTIVPPTGYAPSTTPIGKPSPNSGPAGFFVQPVGQAEKSSPAAPRPVANTDALAVASPASSELDSILAGIPGLV